MIQFVIFLVVELYFFNCNKKSSTLKILRLTGKRLFDDADP